MNIFLNEYFGFCFELNFELNHFSARFNEKMNFQNVSPRANIQGKEADNLPGFLCRCPNKLLSDDFQGNETGHCHHCLMPVFSFQ